MGKENERGVVPLEDRKTEKGHRGFGKSSERAAREARGKFQRGILGETIAIWGISGYIFSFFITHLINFILSIRRLSIVSKVRINLYFPCLSVAAAIIAVSGGYCFDGWVRRVCAFTGLFLSICYFLGIWGTEDILWIKNMLHQKKEVPS